MAITTTTTATAQAAARANMAVLVDGDTLNARVHQMHVAHAIAGTETTNDLILIGYLPAGAKVVPNMSRVSFVGAYTITGKLVGSTDGGTTTSDLSVALASTASGAGAGLSGTVNAVPADADTGLSPLYFKLTSTLGGSPPAASVLNFDIAYKFN